MGKNCKWIYKILKDSKKSIKINKFKGESIIKGKAANKGSELYFSRLTISVRRDYASQFWLIATTEFPTMFGKSPYK